MLPSQVAHLHEQLATQQFQMALQERGAALAVRDAQVQGVVGDWCY